MIKLKDKYEQINVTDFALKLNVSFYDYVVSFLKNLDKSERNKFIINLFYHNFKEIHDYENLPLNFEDNIRKVTSISLKSRINYINNFIFIQKNKIKDNVLFSDKNIDNFSYEIYNLFKELENLYHLIINEIIDIDVENNNINKYIFPNDYKEIPYNTYLYALFNNIYLINYNIENSKFFEKGVMDYFSYRTTIYQEVKNIIYIKSKYNSDKIQILKKIYLNILNLYVIDVKYKEFFILFLWINIYNNLFEAIKSVFLYNEPTIQIFNGYMYFFSQDDDVLNENYFYNEIKKFYKYININKISFDKFKQKNNYFINNNDHFISKDSNFINNKKKFI